MRHLVIRRLAIAALGTAFVGCSSEESGMSNPAGGQASLGGSSASGSGGVRQTGGGSAGGTTPAGGRLASSGGMGWGGTLAAGGNSIVGGNAPTGGSKATGGLSGGSPASGGRNTGGVVAQGGTSTGGSGSATGGGSTAGGGPATGGQITASGGTGGSTNTGGTATGGSPATGGSINTGGTATGGSPATGGSINTGGSTATGGSPGTGGSINTGGSTATGGSPGTGGQITASGGTGGSSSACPYDPCPTNGDACKILPFGDSITWGVGYEGAYRVELFSRAVAAQKKITFTGSLSNGPNTVAGQTFPKSNEGHSGWKIAEIANQVPSPAFNTLPHIVLLMIGTNDVYAGSGQATMPDRLGQLMDKIIAAAPNALLVVAKITPLTNTSWNATVKTYNDAIPALVQSRTAQGKHVILGDMNTGFTSSMMSSDGIHPTQAGYNFMGDAWYATIGGCLH